MWQTLAQFCKPSVRDRVAIQMCRLFEQFANHLKVIQFDASLLLVLRGKALDDREQICKEDNEYRFVVEELLSNLGCFVDQRCKLSKHLQVFIL